MTVKLAAHEAVGTLRPAADLVYATASYALFMTVKRLTLRTVHPAQTMAVDHHDHYALCCKLIMNYGS